MLYREMVYLFLRLLAASHACGRIFRSRFLCSNAKNHACVRMLSNALVCFFAFEQSNPPQGINHKGKPLRLTKFGAPGTKKNFSLATLLVVVEPPKRFPLFEHNKSHLCSMLCNALVCFLYSNNPTRFGRSSIR
jgi:hypothetical protein